MIIFRALRPPRIFCLAALLSLMAFAAPKGALAQILYASSETSNQIFAINTVTQQGSVVLDSTSGFLSSPEGLAYFAPTGDLYIANAGPPTVGGTSGSIVRYNTITGVTSLFVSSTANLDGPQGLAFDAAGNLFATGYNSGTVVEFLNNGMGNLSTTAMTFATGLTNPYYLAFGPTGDLFVANPGAAAPEIRRYTAPNTSTTFETTANAAPIGLAFRNNTLFSSDTVNNTIVGFSNASGDPTTRTTGTVLTPTGLGALNAPQALAYDNNRDVLYAANFGNNNIVRINPDTGASDVLFSGINGPTGLALAPAAMNTPEPPTGLLLLSGMGVGAAGLTVLRRARLRLRRTRP